MLTLAVTLLVGVLAGGLGALLGIGGGVVLVPLVHAVLGRSFREAAAVSLVAVLSTSASVAASTETRKLLNVRLAILLLIFSVSGATFGASVLHLLSEQTYEKIFGITAAVIAVGMLQRLDKRNIRSGVATADPGLLGGRFYDEDTRTHVVYHPRRMPLAMFSAFGAGMLASFLGIGGGILVVPSLNSWCGVPMRVAAATSGFMIGITAIPGAIMHYHLGYLSDFRLAAAAAIGVLIGYRAGLSLSQRTPVRGLKILMAAMLTLVALKYLL